MKVQKGDTIILSSDGLWDVMQADQLQQIIKRNAHMVRAVAFPELLHKYLFCFLALAKFS